MNKTTFALVSILTMFNMPAAHGADKENRFSIRGAGLLSCKTFVEERTKKSPAYMMIGGWLDGYITAFNKLQRNTYDVTPYATTELLSVVINRHCVDNPDDILAPVLDTMLAQLHEDRLDAASPFVAIRVGDYQTSLYAKTVQNIQAKLSQKGIFKGIASGNWNDETQAAIANYQKAIGFDVTGYPDQKTLWHLLRSKK